MDKQKQIEEMPICVNCFHAYVCEEYNINRDILRKRCAYHNDHFFDIEQHGIKTRKETAEKVARLVEFHSVSTRDNDGREYFTISALGLKEILHEEFGIPYDEICKEITGEEK